MATSSKLSYTVFCSVLQSRRNDHLIYTLIYKCSVFDEHADRPGSRCTSPPSPLDTRDDHTLPVHVQPKKAQSGPDTCLMREGGCLFDASRFTGRMHVACMTLG